MTTPPRRPSGATPTDSSFLVSGHATETLSATEQRRLYGAALDDQAVFDQLVEEESWRQVFSAPGVRDNLLEVLAEPTVASSNTPEPWRQPPRRQPFDVVRGWFAGLQVPPLAMGAAAAALIAVALVPRWFELGMTGPVDRGEGSPSGFVAKNYGSQQDVTGDAPATDFVAKSFGGSDREATSEQLTPKSATRGLQSKSTGSGVLNLSYTFELNRPGGPRQVPETWAFRSGDQFRLRFGVDFTAWLYLFNRASGDAVYTVLYPHTPSEGEPLAPSQRDVLLPADFWLTMDETPEDEQLVLVVSTQPWPLVAAGRQTVPARELDAALQQAESNFGALNWRRSEVDNRVRLTMEERGNLMVVLRLL